MKLTSLKLGLCLLLLPTLCMAWFNDQWTSRKSMMLDVTVTGADIQESLNDFPLLIRLHAGNFGYFLDLAENGRDLRFFMDDKTPLHYQVEQVDAINEMGLVWVRLPKVRGGVENDNYWMYYGNANATDGSDSNNLYDTAQSLVYHFKEGEALPLDATAYASHAFDSRAQMMATGMIGAAAQFTGAGPITVNTAPQLAISPDKGWTFSSWVKIDQPQNNAELLDAHEGANGIKLTVQGTALSARWTGAAGVSEIPPVNFGLGRWQHIAVVVKDNKLELYLDGVAVGSTAITFSKVNPVILLGNNLVGLLDEVEIAASARSADWIKLAFRSQSPDFSVLNFGQDETNISGGDGHFLVIVQNVTVDGWVVIGITGIMLVIAILVMISKAIVIRRIAKDNRLFLKKYQQLDHRKLDDLNQDENPEDNELAESDLLTALIGKHDHFQSSPLYHLYHLALQQLELLQNKDNHPVSPEAWNFLRVKMESRIITESQHLNSNMVLLTIAIAGGPFLGLLGTVVGVMITFAAIAATGDVNINSIAPGIAAALLATVAGLAVAIPSLFAYNYLLTQIKDISLGMRVFSNEFLALLALRAAQQHKRNTL